MSVTFFFYIDFECICRDVVRCLTTDIECSWVFSIHSLLYHIINFWCLLGILLIHTIQFIPQLVQTNFKTIFIVRDLKEKIRDHHATRCSGRLLELMEHRTIKWVERYASEVVWVWYWFQWRGLMFGCLGNESKLKIRQKKQKNNNQNVTVYIFKKHP